ncbi:protease complex subunit PrcB family protein [Zunongwangia pacifica]|uniref:PrcB C-terminal domain-containing protein n=1 Tax=Zunongwangia pacifica TaxID=2911062 RepID=A0A9X2CMM0_9FLAO|nr:protease complex subunit PrcB family protein [Zunongwangia pacifica]MCL6219630.1 hypothetical protein [Zunongwangia pacifica]
MNPTLIAEGNLYGNGNDGLVETNMVLKNQAEWKEVAAKMNKINATIKEEQIDAIDFDKQMVIVLIDQQRTKGGHSIKIAAVDNKMQSVVISIQKSHPEGMATMVMTQPYYVATIPKTDKQIEFEEVK